MNLITATLAINVANLRKAQKLSQKQLAQKAGIHFGTLSNIECGARPASLAMAEKLAKALGVSYARLFKE